MADLLSVDRLLRAARFLWGLVLLTLPVTSFRYLPDFMGRTLVQPLAFYPLAGLLLVLLLLFWRQRQIPLPSNIRILLAFLLIVLIGSLLGFLFAPIDLRGASYDERLLRGWFSLLTGLLFFFAAFWMTRSQEDLQASLKWIYVALGLTILWSLAQAIAIHTDLIPRSLINQIQTSFSARPLLPRRVSGFAYEPAWLADQITIFFVPWLLAAVLNGRNLLKFKWLEPLLLLLSLAVLLATYSRGGLAIAVVSAVVVLLVTGRKVIASAWAWFSRPFRKMALGPLAVRIAILLSLAVGVFFTARFLADYPYFANVWDIEEGETLQDYVVDISAGPRLAYSIAGYEVFEDHPLTGIGLGASGLVLVEHYPDWSLNISEIARQVSPDSNQIPNIKNLYVRLLAETGLPGFWLYTVFFLSFLAVVLRMFRGDAFLRFVATAGLFIMLAIALRNFTQDSFTFPVMWVTLGMIIGLAPKSPENFELERS